MKREDGDALVQAPPPYLRVILFPLYGRIFNRLKSNEAPLGLRKPATGWIFHGVSVLRECRSVTSGIPRTIRSWKFYFRSRFRSSDSLTNVLRTVRAPSLPYHKFEQTSLPWGNACFIGSISKWRHVGINRGFFELLNLPAPDVPHLACVPSYVSSVLWPVGGLRSTSMYGQFHRIQQLAE